LLFVLQLSGIIGQRKLDDFLGKVKRQETAMRSRLKAYMEGKSLRVFTTSNPFRRACFNLVTNTWFEVAVITCIIVNCIIITFQTPDLDPESFTADFIDVRRLMDPVWGLHCVLTAVSAALCVFISGDGRCVRLYLHLRAGAQSGVVWPVQVRVLAG